MPAKTANRNKVSAAPVVKDDGSRYTVLAADSDRQIYSGGGVPLSDAVALAQGLAAPSRVVAFDGGVIGDVKYVVS